ncbi:MAG: hypothetical protein AAF515_16810 [Pseudomonadota bacterium]
MGREVRRVPPDWAHPIGDNGQYKPLRCGEMPDPHQDSATHYQMYETTSEGTPISLAMESPQALAQWLVDNEASAFAGQTASYEAWLQVCEGRSVVSGVFHNGRVLNGVEHALPTAKRTENDEQKPSATQQRHSH